MVNAISLYQVREPTAQVANKVEFPPAQIVNGLPPAPVGAAGEVVIVTVTGVAALLHVPLTHAP